MCVCIFKEFVIGGASGVSSSASLIPVEVQAGVNMSILYTCISPLSTFTFILSHLLSEEGSG